jgi:hypothetical protein
MRLRVAPVLLAILLLVTACSVARGSGKLATESRQVSGFSKVELSGVGEVMIDKTGDESLTISAEDNLLPKLTSEVSGGTLVLGTKPNTSIVPTKPITYTLTVKDLTGLAVSGSGSIRAINLSTSSLSSEISGSGAITASGTVDDQTLDISGSGKYQADQLTSKRAKIQISGSGSASVLVSDMLEVKMSGSGSLTYSGNPQITQEVSGSGKLIKK